MNQQTGDPDEASPDLLAILCVNGTIVTFGREDWLAGNGLVKFLVTDIAAFDPSHPDPIDRTS